MSFVRFTKLGIESCSEVSDPWSLWWGHVEKGRLIQANAGKAMVIQFHYFSLTM